MSVSNGTQPQSNDKLALGRQMVRKFAGDKHVDAVAASMVSFASTDNRKCYCHSHCHCNQRDENEVLQN